jgi:hypothetical protein
LSRSDGVHYDLLLKSKDWDSESIEFFIATLLRLFFEKDSPQCPSLRALEALRLCNSVT